jgi:hypothetical protein
MLFLSNSDLCISVLDPVSDRNRLGPRFCTGGYVYQIEHARHGPIFSGPEYPSEHPSVLNGQGIPDVFQFTLFDKPDERPEKKLIVGVGLIGNPSAQRAIESHFHSPVEEFCRWSTDQSPTQLVMKTTQVYRNWGLRLARALLLEGNCLTTRSELRCTGLAHLPFRWFAHPFFPLNHDRRCCRIPRGYTLLENEGFIVDRESVLHMHPTYDWTKGEYTLLGGTLASDRFEIFQLHPALSAIRVTCDFLPSKVALWANDRTFSFEPFHESVLQPGESTHWSMTYEFIGGDL